MDMKNIYGEVIYSAPNAKTQQEALNQAIKEKISLKGWVIKECIFPQGITLQDCAVSDCKVSYCTVSDCTVSDCKVSDCKVSRGTVSGKSIVALKGYSGLYAYNVWAVLFKDGSRWVRMGCLFKSLEEWEKIGIRKSNVSEYPNDGSDKCEERVAAFEFAKAAALRMKA